MRRKLKNGGKRRKAGLGADGALMAAATLAASAANVAATIKSADTQAKAVDESAKVQAEAIEAQDKNNTQLQKDMISFQTEQKQQDRDLMNDMNTTMQMMAGQQNMNDMLNQNRMQAKYGKGISRRRKLKSVEPSYGGANKLVETTDGGQAIPLAIDNFGYGVYELRGDNHEQYHKAQGGKYKSGVGVRTKSGEIVEGEGSKNGRPGELYVKDYDHDYFLSRHNINGFNPTEAVLQGMSPEDAFKYQEINKAILGVDDDGTKINKNKSNRNKLKCGGRPKAYTGMGVYGGGWYSPRPLTGMALSAPNTTASVTVPTITTKATSNNSNGGGTNAWSNGWLGATINAGANLASAGINWLGNRIASNQISRANQHAYDTLATAYGNLHTIDMDILDGNESWDAPQTLAVIRDPHVSAKPQEERINRDARYESREINRNTLSSAARLNRLASTDDRRQQRLSEVQTDVNNRREAILDNSLQAINETTRANADRKMQWRKDNTAARMQLAMYNNDIENMKITGPAQAKADMLMGNAQAKSAYDSASWQGLGTAITNSAAGYASTFDGLRREQNNYYNTMFSANTENQVAAAINRNDSLGTQSAINLYNALKNNTDSDSIKYVQQLRSYLASKKIYV